MIVKNVEKQENKTAVFTVEAEPAEFEAAVNGAYLKNRSQINIPGFRKGKAPRAVVEGMYGPEVFYQDAMDELAPKAYEKGLEESGLRVVGTPSIKNVEVTEARGVSYAFEVELYPEVTLGEYKGIKAVRASETVTDEEVDAELESVRKRNARKLSVEREAQMGDAANIDFDGFLNGERFDGGKAEGYSLTLGSGSFVPGFEEQIVGMKIGEEKDIDITFPEDYVENLAGKAVVFKVKLNGLTVDELPELDDEFAQDVSEFDTLEAYKADLRSGLEKRRADQVRDAFRAAVMKKAADGMKADVPDSMIRERAEEILRNYASNFGMDARNMPMEQLMSMMGLDEAAMTQSVMPGAELQVRTDLMLEAVIKAENIEPSEDELKAYVQRIAESVGREPEEMEKYFGREFILDELRKEQAGDFLVDNAVVVEEEEEESAEKSEE